MLTAFVKRQAGGVAVVAVNDEAATMDAALPTSLLLINRVLDGRFGTRSGVELIEQTLACPAPPAAMLVSNYADAQSAAVAVGALPGFGKSELGRPETSRKLRDAVGADAAA